LLGINLIQRRNAGKRGEIMKLRNITQVGTILLVLVFTIGLAGAAENATGNETSTVTATVTATIVRGPALLVSDNNPETISLPDNAVVTIKKSPQTARILVS